LEVGPWALTRRNRIRRSEGQSSRADARGGMVSSGFGVKLPMRSIEGAVMGSEAPAEAGSCRVAEVMGTELFTLTPDTVVASAQRLAFDNGVRHMLVLDGTTLTGIVCD